MLTDIVTENNLLSLNTHFQKKSSCRNINNQMIIYQNLTIYPHKQKMEKQCPKW